MSHQTLVNFILSFLHRNSSVPGVEVQSNGTSSWNIFYLSQNNLTKYTIDSLSDDGPSYNLFNYYVFLCTLWCLCSFSPSSSKLSFVCAIKSITEMFILNSTLILCLPSILIINTSVSISRALLRLHLRVFHRGKVFLMNSADAFWSLEEYAQSCNFNVMFVVKGDCNIQTIRHKFTKLIENPVYDKMRRLVVQKFGYFCWKMVDHVDITQHVKYLSKSKLTESQLFDKMREFNDQIFKQDKPPWEVLVVPKYSYDIDNNKNEQNNYYAVIFRVHHALMDGISAGQAIRKEIADGNVKLSVDPCAPINISIWQKIGVYILLLTIGVRSVVRALSNFETNIFHTGQQLTGPKNIGWSRKIDLDRLKNVKIKTQSTTTAILLNAFACALRNAADKKKLILPSQISAAATVAFLPYPDTKPQNRFNLAHLTIDTAGGQSRVQRLRQIHTSVRNLARSPDVIINRGMLWLVGRWPVFVQKIVFKLVHATVLVSNVPGFKEETNVFGGKLVDAVGWTPVKGTTGIGMCLFSYNGQLRAALAADKVSLPHKSDLKNLIADFENELEKLTSDINCMSCFTQSH